MTGVPLCMSSMVRIAWLRRGGEGWAETWCTLWKWWFRAMDSSRGFWRCLVGQDLVRMEGAAEVLGPRTLYCQGLEGCTELGTYLGASKALAFSVFAVAKHPSNWPPCLSFHPPSPCLLSVKTSLCLPSWLSECTTCKAEIASSSKSFLTIFPSTRDPCSLCIRRA